MKDLMLEENFVGSVYVFQYVTCNLMTESVFHNASVYYFVMFAVVCDFSNRR